MVNFNVLNSKEIAGLVRSRSGEERIGASVAFITKPSELEKELTITKRRFVIVGIPEDIGVRANMGRGGANTAFIPGLDSFLNQQSNSFLNGDDICVAGAINVEDLMKEAEHLNAKIPDDLKKLRDLTAKIDARVKSVLNCIVSCKKIPIVIGGGHNNAYGIIAGSSEALKAKLNVINCDAHADLRIMEGRHSGNGFTYAYYNGFMGKYAVLGIHEQYNNLEVLTHFTKEPGRFMFQSFEDIFVREKFDFQTAMNRVFNFVGDGICGIELDLDAITNVPSSAKTSSGISSLQARQYVYNCGKKLNPIYLHIAEGAPVLAHRKADNKTGKLIAYLITDFIKGVLEKEN